MYTQDRSDSSEPKKKIYRKQLIIENAEKKMFNQWMDYYLEGANKEILFIVCTLHGSHRYTVVRHAINVAAYTSLELPPSNTLSFRCYVRDSPALPFSIHFASTWCCLYGLLSSLEAEARRTPYTTGCCVHKFVARQHTAIHSHRTHDDNLTHCWSLEWEWELHWIQCNAQRWLRINCRRRLCRWRYALGKD